MDKNYSTKGTKPIEYKLYETNESIELTQEEITRTQEEIVDLNEDIITLQQTKADNYNEMTKNIETNNKKIEELQVEREHLIMSSGDTKRITELESEISFLKEKNSEDSMELEMKKLDFDKKIATASDELNILYKKIAILEKEKKELVTKRDNAIKEYEEYLNAEKQEWIEYKENFEENIKTKVGVSSDSIYYDSEIIQHAMYCLKELTNKEKDQNYGKRKLDYNPTRYKEEKTINNIDSRFHSSEASSTLEYTMNLFGEEFNYEQYIKKISYN